MKTKNFFSLLIILFLIFFNTFLVAQIKFIENSILHTIIDNPKYTISADLDLDNDVDLLVASLYGNNIIWFENDGYGNFISVHIVTTLAEGALSVVAADLDGDGNFGPQILVTTLVDMPKSVFCTDLDNDGDKDIISASWDNKIAWYENDGFGSFGQQ